MKDDKQKENEKTTFKQCNKLEFDSFQSANESENQKEKEHPFNKEKQKISIIKKYINTNDDKVEIENVKKRILNSNKSLDSKENEIYISPRLIEKDKKSFNTEIELMNNRIFTNSKILGTKLDKDKVSKIENLKEKINPCKISKPEIGDKKEENSFTSREKNNKGN